MGPTPSDAPSGLVQKGLGFFFPVVPKAQTRIRTQLSAAHEKRHLDRAIVGMEDAIAVLSRTWTFPTRWMLRPTRRATKPIARRTSR